jgi:hypothetical protein
LDPGGTSIIFSCDISLVCRTIAELASDFGVRLNQIVNWKKAAVGRGGEKVLAAGVSAHGTAGEADVDVLYGQIG